MRAAVTFAVLLFLGFAGPAGALGTKLYPVDEAAAESSFSAFRTRLLQALKAHDKTFLLSILSPQVAYSYARAPGTKGFVEWWRLGRPDSPIWRRLSEALSLGGSFTDADRKGFCAPYVYSRWPDAVDPIEHAAILGTNVPVRKEPKATAPALTTVSYDIVKVVKWPYPADEQGLHGWFKIATPSGTTGFVAEGSVRSPGDYHACFGRAAGKWLMTAFLAGG